MCGLVLVGDGWWGLNEFGYLFEFYRYFFRVV